MMWFGRYSSEQKQVLAAMWAGSQLKSHRYLDGTKVYQLHPLDENGKNSVPVTAAAVEGLKRRGLIKSNMKFPAATYLLTAEGARVAASLVPLHPPATRLSHSKEQE